MLEELIRNFHQKLTYDRANGLHIHQAELAFLYRNIIELLSENYNTYRQFHPYFLSILETNNTSSIPFEVDYFIELFEKLIIKKDHKHFDISILDFVAKDETIEKYKNANNHSWQKNNQPRVSDFDFDFSDFSEDEKKEVVSIIIEKLQIESKILVWDQKMIESNLLLIIPLRSFLNSLDNIELFYQSIGLYSDRVASSEFFQSGRDFSEEILIASFKDKVPELGFLHAFRFYSTTKNVHAAFLYASICLSISIKKQVSDKFVKEIIWQGIKFFRNIHLYHWVERIYNKIPHNLPISDYERRSIDHSYFSSLLLLHTEELPSLLLDYLNKERENLFIGGFHDALPWLITLYNLKRVYPNADFSTTALGFYLNIFESIIPKETVERHKKLIFGDSPELKNLLIESLIKVNETRNEIDFVYDISNPILISNKLIEYSSANKDFPGFMLAMMLKSDYSILFKPKDSGEVMPFKLPTIEVESYSSIYEDFDSFISALPDASEYSLILLASVEGKVYTLTLKDREVNFFFLTDWSNEKLMELKKKEYFASLDFNDTIKDDAGVREVSPEEHEAESIDITNNLLFSKLIIPDDSKSLFVIKDIQLSGFPHNLLLNQEGSFISQNIPVTNVLSTEWFFKMKNTRPLNKNLSKSIWIPIESGDMALNYLYSKVEPTVLSNSFEIHTGINLKKPLSSDLNIVCCHGDRDIAEIQVVSHETGIIYNLDEVIGSGRILILIVCHSGSMKTEFFRNSVSSLMKRFLSKGYDSVIAPAWAFDGSISNIWFPEFLSQIDSGSRIDYAVYYANKKVYDRFPTPAAWACLHLFGNPFLKLA